MKIKKVNVLVSSIDEKVNSTTNLPYWSVGILDLSDGTNFTMNVKDKEVVSKLKIMNKFEMDFSIQDSKYGMRLNLDGVGENLGGIM